MLQTLLFTLRSNKLFELFVVGIILLSALVIGVKSYSMPSVHILAHREHPFRSNVNTYSGAS